MGITPPRLLELKKIGFKRWVANDPKGSQPIDTCSSSQMQKPWGQPMEFSPYFPSGMPSLQNFPVWCCHTIDNGKIYKPAYVYKRNGEIMELTGQDQIIAGSTRLHFVPKTLGLNPHLNVTLILFDELSGIASMLYLDKGHRSPNTMVGVAFQLLENVDSGNRVLHALIISSYGHDQLTRQMAQEANLQRQFMESVAFVLMRAEGKFAKALRFAFVYPELVEGLESIHFNPSNHKLDLVRLGDLEDYKLDVRSKSFPTGKFPAIK